MPLTLTRTALSSLLRRFAAASVLATLFATLPGIGLDGGAPALAGSRNQSYNVEDARDFQDRGDAEEAERNFSGAGAGRSDPGIPSPAVLDQMMEQGAAVAQFKCSVKGAALYGMGTMGQREGQPIDMEVTLTKTGIAIVNGQAIQPTETKPRSPGTGGNAIESALYPMEEVRRALAGPGLALPSAGFTNDERRQLEGFGGILNGMIDGMTAGRNRHMMISLPQNGVGFFDIAAGNRVTNAQAASCFRVQ